ncbi:TetR/AcrR family transcriptional regulator [Nocardiopsis dassonvillei]|jgi:DNA-binding transcriptional regulator YbjK|uniref:TetR/AcrR family transcriptional regulator n=1 Tax=Nocardiopsis dassonvillei TaxID=2014 RepID=UPI001EE15D16|nr:TetR family transcriptional regulator [Nocardiopsis dassonvillei]
MSATNGAATRSPRDPEARRRALVRAAAELILESGDLTHRQVAARAKVPLGSTTYYFASLGDLRAAALEQLADEINDELAVIAQQVAEADGDPRVLAGLLHAYLSNTDQVRADAALYSNAAQDPALRHLALRWFDGFVQMASAWTDPVTAHNIGVYIDGVTLHATLADEPLDLTTLTRGLTALLRPRDEEA